MEKTIRLELDKPQFEDLWENRKGKMEFFPNAIRIFPQQIFFIDEILNKVKTGKWIRCFCSQIMYQEQKTHLWFDIVQKFGKQKQIITK